MKLEKLNPWNWFKHEQQNHDGDRIPVRRDAAVPAMTDPFDSFRQLHQEMDRLFNDAFSSMGLTGLTQSLPGEQRLPGSTGLDFRPKVDVAADGNQYKITFDLPGMTQDDVSIELQDRVLTLRGERESDSESDQNQYYCVERSYGSFQRTLSLPEDASADDIQANMKNGVLTLTIPRVPVAENDVKRIEIAS